MTLIFDWPQLIWLGLALFGIGWTAVNHGRPSHVDARIQTGAVFAMALLLYWGGFFGR